MMIEGMAENIAAVDVVSWIPVVWSDRFVAASAALAVPPPVAPVVVVSVAVGK